MNFKAVIVLVLGALFGYFVKGQIMHNRPIELVRVRIGTGKNIPDPAKIETSGEWYFLDHISSGLFSYDHELNEFVPNIAEKWNISESNQHVFKLRNDLKFSDGSPITPDDVLWSIKRLLIQKTSTHLPLWSYVVGCENLKDISEQCKGIKIDEDGNLVIQLKTRSESFFLQLASPETGIWSKDDIDSKTMAIKPTKFSGPYSVLSKNEKGFLLERNENSIVSKHFPNSPKRIELVSVPLAEAQRELESGNLDLVLRSHNPFGETDLSRLQIKVHKTAPSTIIYLYGVHHKKPLKLIGQDLVKSIWESKADEALPATTFLPFASNYSLTKDQFLSDLPESSARTIKVGKPWTFYSDKFIETIVTAGKKVGVDIQMVEMSPAEWSDAFEDPKAGEKVDFILTPYIASDRYPTVQLRMLTGTMKNPPIDLLKAESPDLTPDKIEVLKNYQHWMLETQSAMPLYFSRMHIYHKQNINIGSQSKTDGEIELWRLTGN